MSDIDDIVIDSDTVSLDFETKVVPHATAIKRGSNPEDNLRVPCRNDVTFLLASVGWIDKDGNPQGLVCETKDEFLAIWKMIKNKKIVFHHFQYDGQVLMGMDIDPLIDFEDTFIMAKLLDETRGNGLKDLRVSVLGKPERAKYKDIRKSMDDVTEQYKKALQVKDDEKCKVLKEAAAKLWDDFIQYALDDATDTIELYNKLLVDWSYEDLNTVYQLEKLAIYPTMDMEFYGLEVDTQLLAFQDTILEKDLNEIEEKLVEKAGKEFNMRSPKQLQELVYEKFKVLPRAEWKTKTGYSTSSDVMEAIADMRGISKDGKEFATLMVRHRKAAKLRSGYTSGLKPKLVGGRVYASFNKMGTDTGRFSSSNPNLQQIPRDSIRPEYKAQAKAAAERGDKVLSEELMENYYSAHIRSLFRSETGKKMIVYDLSQIELRMTAILSRDPAMVASFLAGEDLHQALSDWLQEQGINVDRNGAKGLNFGTIYGMGPGSFSAQTGLPFKTAAEAMDGYWERHPKIKKLIEFISMLTKKNLFVQTISGRKRRFPVIDFSTERKAFNTLIQGSSADYLKLVMVLTWFEMDKSKARFSMQVHDELNIIADEDYVEECAAILKKNMETALSLDANGNDTGVIPIPVLADGDIAEVWSKAK